MDNYKDVKSEVKTRLAALGSTQSKLFKELNKRGYKITDVQAFYQVLAEIKCVGTPRGEEIINGCRIVLNEWEAKAKGES
ncbi:MAG: hypothetical protein FWG90_01675 [Oscillospiraceae bacterium]|nr:hypothetical protein [Oscillospiraceae bacterium]